MFKAILNIACIQKMIMRIQLINFHKLDTTMETVPTEKKNTTRAPVVSLAPLPHSPYFDTVDYFCLFLNLYKWKQTACILLLCCA